MAEALVESAAVTEPENRYFGGIRKNAGIGNNMHAIFQSLFDHGILEFTGNDPDNQKRMVAFTEVGNQFVIEAITRRMEQLEQVRAALAITTVESFS